MGRHTGQDYLCGVETSLMKAYIADFNNVLLDVKKRVELVSDPRDADVLILWQDVRGSMRTLADINLDYMGKPVVIVQHGRGATRDYLPPNSFKLVADRICVWGQKEWDRMDKAGYGDRAIITGSPLVHWTRNPRPRQLNIKDRKVIVFTPVITSHEEVDNIEVALELRKIEYTIAQETMRQNRKGLKSMWHSWVIDPEVATENQIPYELLHKEWNVIHKLTDMHDSKLYHGEHIKTTVTHTKHLENSHIILSNCDCVVGLEEGTFQLMASAMGIPTVIVDGFEYGAYGGVQEYKPEIIRTDATSFCQLDNLRNTIQEELNNPQQRKDARLKVVQEEFDPYPDKDPIELIIDVASELCGGDIRVKSTDLVEV